MFQGDFVRRIVHADRGLFALPVSLCVPSLVVSSAALLAKFNISIACVLNGSSFAMGVGDAWWMALLSAVAD